MIKVKSYKELSQITDCKDGEIGYVEIKKDRFKPFVFNAKTKEWNSKMGESKTNLTAYDLNKQQISKLPDYDWENGTEEAEEKIKKYINSFEDKYFMYLCYDLRYFTLFHRNENEEIPLEKELVNILKEQPLGTVKTIDVYSLESTGTEVCEIWTYSNKQAYVSYLFPYEKGVVECK